jgi:hypothetical protein
MPSQVARSLASGEPSKRPRHALPLPFLGDDLVRRIRREGCQISEHLNVLYHEERYRHMHTDIRSMRAARSELGRLLHWIHWERMWSAAGVEGPFYHGGTIRLALEGLSSEDRQRELEGDY